MTQRCWCGADVIRERFDGVDEGSAFCSASQFHNPVRDGVIREPRVLYLAGPMSGYEDCNYPAFNKAAESLREWGYTVHNPAEIGDMGSQYVDLLKKDIRILIDCEGIAVMEDWWNSKGARLETTIAATLGLPIRPVAEWITRGAQR